MKRPTFVLCFLILAVATFAVVLPSSAGTLLMKYSPGGEQLWVVSDDRQEGYADDSVFLDPFGGIYTYRDDFVAKYRSNGFETWRYEGEMSGLALDSGGNLFVPCGQHCISKRDRNGNVLWERDVGEQIIAEVITDAAGNLLLNTYTVVAIDEETGQIMKFSPDGEQLWVFDYRDSGDVDPKTYVHEFFADNQGNFYFRSIRQGLEGISKFDADASLVWRANITDLYPEFIELDEDSNVYVASGGNYVGYLLPGATFAIAKINSSGEREWTTLHDWSSGDDYGSEVVGLAVTPEGDLAVVGYAAGWSTVVMAADGEQLWEAQLSDGQAGPTGVAVDPEGNVVSVGYRCTCGEEEIACCEMVIVKYSADGTMEWGTTYDHPADDRDEATGVTADEEGNIYVVGRYGYADDDLDENEGCGC